MFEKSIEIRPLNSGDVTAYRAIRLQAIEDSPSAVWVTKDEERQRTDQEVVTRIERGNNQVVLGAFDATELVAIAGLRRDSLIQVSHKGTLWGVFVLPSWRKKGLGKRIVSASIEYARENSIRQVNLTVNSTNIKAKNLYDSLGFVTFGVEPDSMQVKGQFFDEIHMQLQLR